MRVDREQIVALLAARGRDDLAMTASRELPESVDTERHQDALERLGLEPTELADDFRDLADKTDPGGITPYA